MGESRHSQVPSRVAPSEVTLQASAANSSATIQRRVRPSPGGRPQAHGSRPHGTHRAGRAGHLLTEEPSATGDWQLSGPGRGQLPDGS